MQDRACHAECAAGNQPPAAHSFVSLLREGTKVGYDCGMSETSPHANPAEADEKNWLALLSSTEVFGPFTYAELKGYLESGQIAATAQFFRKEGSLEGAESRVESLVRRAAEAEERFRGAEAESTRLGADLKAKDLEFEGERKQMSADVAKLRADIVRRDAEIETLRKSVERLDGLEKERLGLETKALEAERSGQEWKARAERLEAEVAELRRAAQERGRRIAELATSLRELAEEGVPQAEPEGGAPRRPGPGLAKKPSRRVEPAVHPIEEVEVVEPEPAAPGTGSDGARLASLEAQAQEELARLRSRNGGVAMPRWSRRQA